MSYITDRRHYLAADGETVVEEGDPRAAILLFGMGAEVSDADAARYGLKAKAPAANKAKAGPAENKER